MKCRSSAHAAAAAHGQLARLDELSAIISCFQPGIVHAIGYGSGVFVQQQQSSLDNVDAEKKSSGCASFAADNQVETIETDAPMIDLLLTVSDSISFHTQNLQRYPNHYSALARLCGPKFCNGLQRSERCGAGVFFNPLVDSPAAASDVNDARRGRKIKYGVIQIDDLINDLTTWRWLYVAGRMHKPTVTVEGLEDCDRVAVAQKQNLDMALAASLLLLGSDASNIEIDSKTYELTTLFEKIASLSYKGDPRMDVGGEDPHKIG